MIKGWKKLTKSERRHVTFDAGCRCTSAWLRNIEHHVAREKETGETQCHDCKAIARKLGDWPGEK